MASVGTKLCPDPGNLNSTLPIQDTRETGTGIRFRQTPWRARHLMFVVADLAAIWSGALVALSLRFSFHVLHDPLGYPSTITGHLAFLLLYSGLIVLFSNTQRLYSDYQHPCTRLEVYAVTRSVAMASVLLAVCIYVSGIHFISRLIIAITMLHAVFAMSGWRYMRRKRIRAAVADGLICHNVVIVGTNRTAQAVKRHLNESSYLGFVVRGLLVGDLQDDTHESTIGTIDDLVAVCRTQFIDEVIVCAQSREIVNRVVADGRRLGFGVRLVPDMYDGNLWETKLEYLGELGSLTVHDRKVPVLQLKLKRAIDVVCSCFGLIALSPILALLAAVVKLNSKGPVLYISERVGRKGRTFRCYKFRTMVSNADQLKEKLKHLNERDGILFKIANDPRITKVGQYLRKYSLDELPQLWNVLKGDMSIVGPRPPIASEVERYELEYLRRLDAAPGITGLWQVQARRNPSFDRYIALDLEYVEQWSLALDLRILLKTIGVVFAGTGQ